MTTDNPAAMDGEALQAALEQSMETDPNVTPGTDNEADVQKQSAEAQPDPTPEPEKDGTGTEQSVDDLKAQIETLNKRLRDKDSHIGKQRNELEQVKKRLSQLTVPPEPTNEEFFENPAEANKALKKHEDALKEREQLEQQKQFIELMENNHSIVTQVVPDFAESIEQIGKVLMEEDGLDVNTVSNFLQNPFAADPVAVIQMAKRAKSAHKLSELTAENEQLKAQIEELKAKPGKMLSSVDRAVRNGPPVSSKQGRSRPAGSDADISDSQRAQMSTEELMEALKQAAKEE